MLTAGETCRQTRNTTACTEKLDAGDYRGFDERCAFQSDEPNFPQPLFLIQMIADHSKLVIKKAKPTYEPMRKRLESDENGKFIAIEPESGDTFVAASFDEAVNTARSAHPRRVSHTIKIGAGAAFHIGVMVSSRWTTQRRR